MQIAKKATALVAGVASLALLAGTVPASALSKTQAQDNKNLITLEQKSGEAVDIATELDCSSHTTTAKVTNKTDVKISPTVTFNKDTPAYDVTAPIEPGKTTYYMYNFSGNHLLMNVTAAVDGYADLTVSPALHCEEPVSFRVSETSETAVTGYLQNNSSLVAQTVLTRVNNGDIRTESLDPGESRLIALPFNNTSEAKTAYVTIGTPSGFEGSYSVDLTIPIDIPL